MGKFLVVLRQLFIWRSYLIAILTPCFLSLLFLYDGTEFEKPARCTFVLLMLVIFWTSECIPIAVTALLPMFLYPLFKITTAKELAPKYMSEVNMAFIGSYIMVIAFENANLHKRFALKILMTVGPQPRWLLFGTMMSASCLSMFTNNTMSCALHLPIVKGIIDELREAANKRAGKSCQAGQDEKQVQVSSCPTPTIVITETSTTIVGTVPVPKIEITPTSDLAASTEDLEDVDKAPTDHFELKHLEQKQVGVLEIRSFSEPPVDSSLPINRYLNKDSGVNTNLLAPAIAVSPSEISLSIPREDEEDVLSMKTIDGLEKMLLIAAAYSASIGGMCTLIGTPTNLVMKERADQVFDVVYNCTQPVTFTSWLVFGVPVGFSFIFVAWFWLQIFFLGPKYVFGVWIIEPIRRLFGSKPRDSSKAKARAAKQAARITAVITQLYDLLEPMGFHQYAVLAHCFVLIVLLITRQMSTGEGANFLGWGIIAPKYVKESTATIMVAASMFVFPSRLPSFRTASAEAPPTLLKWRQVDKEFPFGVILLLGGGMAAAAGAQDSGLPAIIAPVFRDIMQELSMSFAVLLTSIMVASMTEFMSNIACVTLLAPIMEKLAKELNVNPLLFLFPTTLSASFAFMLPVATPPNALVFSTNRLRIIDMVLCGVGMNIIGVIVVFLATNTWGNTYFDLYNPPCSARDAVEVISPP